MVRQRFNDLPIHEIQNNRPLVDQRNLGAERSHKGCVLEAYNASSHYDDFFRQATQIAKVIGVHNAMVVKGNVRAVRGPGIQANVQRLKNSLDQLGIPSTLSVTTGGYAWFNFRRFLAEFVKGL